MEITLPLLEEYKLEPEPPEPEKVASQERAGKNTGKGKNKSKSNISKGKKGEDSPYAAPNEYEHEVNTKFKNTSFKTDRLPWMKIIQYPQEALRVEVPVNIENKLTIMRDTFRSKVNVKAIFTQVLPPQKPSKKDKKDKKGKEKGKGKAKDKGKGGGKKDKENIEKPMTPAPVPEPEPEPTETIVKKITLANFNCELQVPNWDKKMIDYYWCKHDKFPPNKGVQVEGSLSNIIYKEAKKKNKGKDKKEKGGKGKNDKEKKGKEKKDKGKNGKNLSKSSLSSKGSKKGSKSKVLHEEDEFVIMKVAPKEDFLPDVFTVQVGFGLNRKPPKHKVLAQETNLVNAT